MKQATKMAFIMSVMFFLGLIGFGSISAASASASVEQTERVEEQFSLSNSSTISIELSFSDLYIDISPDDTLHITYYNTEHFEYELKQNADEFILKQTQLTWGNFNYPNEVTTVTVLIPKQFSGALTVDTSSGSINTDTISAGSIDLSASSGSIKAQDISSSGDISITASSGNIDLRDVKSTDGTLTVNTSSGDKTLENVSAYNIHAKSQSGKSDFEQIVCTDIRITSSSGSIKFNELNAQNITIDSSSGSVRGSLVGNSSDFAVTSRTSSGANNLPREWGSGNKMLDVRTSSGNIDVSFTE